MQQHFIGMCSSLKWGSSLFATRMVEPNDRSTDAFSGANVPLKGIIYAGVLALLPSLSYPHEVFGEPPRSNKAPAPFPCLKCALKCKDLY
jgi:hypothetical protein